MNRPDYFACLACAAVALALWPITLYLSGGDRISRRGWVNAARCSMKWFFHYLKLWFLLPIHVRRLMATQAQLADDLKAVTAQVAKIGVETGKTLQKVIDLEAIIAAGGNTTPEVDAALAALKTQAQATDDMIPDESTP